MTDDNLDPEIRAIQNVTVALAGLDPDSTRRVLKWALDKYQVKPGAGGATAPAGYEAPASHPAATPAPTAVPTYADFADLFDAADPQSGVEYALVAAYWFQAVQKHAELDSQQLNSALKNLGRPSSNITRDLDSLITRTPRLVIQVRKDGSTKQARKRYKLTTEGVRAVDRMLTRNGRPDPGRAAQAEAPNDGEE